MSFLPGGPFWSNPANVVSLHLRQQQAVEEQQRLQRYKRAWQYYYGHGKRPLTVRKGQPNDNVISNKGRTIVDKGVSYLFGQDITFQIDEGADTAREQWLNDCWTANKKMTTLQKLAVNGGVCGHPFVQFLRPDSRPNSFPRVVVLDPANVSVYWRPDDIEEIARYVIQWSGADPDDGSIYNFRKVITPVGGGTSWSIRHERSQPDSSVWELVLLEAWPFDFPPVAHCQNLPTPNEFWGMPDLTPDILDAIDARNFLLSNMQRIIRFHAHPKTVLTGANVSQVRIAVDEMIGLDDKDAKLYNVEMQSDLASSLELDRRIDEAIHEISRVPPVATGRMDNLDALSGVALQLRFQPLLEVTRTKRELYGDLLNHINWCLLVLGGQKPGATSVAWFELLPKDPVQERQIALADYDLGASSETLLDKFGYDAAAEHAKRKKEDEAKAELAQAEAEAEAGLAAKMKIQKLALPPPRDPGRKQ